EQRPHGDERNTDTQQKLNHTEDAPHERVGDGDGANEREPRHGESRHARRGNIRAHLDDAEPCAVSREPRLSRREQRHAGPGDATQEGEKPATLSGHRATLLRAFATATARSGAAAFARVSSNSVAGSDCATIPAPACTRATPPETVVVRIVIARSRSPP